MGPSTLAAPCRGAGWSEAAKARAAANCYSLCLHKDALGLQGEKRSKVSIQCFFSADFYVCMTMVPSRCYYSSLRVPAPGVAADCWTRHPGRQARAQAAGHLPCLWARQLAIRSRAPSPPPLVAWRLTACPTICAPSLTLLLAGLRVVPCRLGLAQGHARAPRSRHSNGRRLRHPARRGAASPRRRAQGTARFRGSATRSAALSTSALHGCGCLVRVSGDTRVASQHKAWPVGVAPYTSMSRHRQSPECQCGGRGVCKPLLRDHLPLRPNRFAGDANTRTLHHLACGASRPVRGQAST